MKTSERPIGKILLGTGVMAIISVVLMAVMTAGIQNGILPIERLGMVGYIIHFAAVYLGSLISIGIVKEKKGIRAGVSAVCWYVVLLFISIVLLDGNVGNIAASIGAGACGYGTAFLTCIVPKKRTNNRSVKFRSR